MDLISFVTLIIVLGLVWWGLSFLPMPPAGKTALTIAFVIIVILGLLSFLGIGDEWLHYRPNHHHL